MKQFRLVCKGIKTVTLVEAKWRAFLQWRNIHQIPKQNWRKPQLHSLTITITKDIKITKNITLTKSIKWRSK